MLELTRVSRVEDPDFFQHSFHFVPQLWLGRVPLGLGEEGDEEGHALAAVGTRGGLKSCRRKERKKETSEYYTELEETRTE
jgi:hypothetical protein